MRTRKRKTDSDNDSLYKFMSSDIASVGPPPYDNNFDLSKNGRTHIDEVLRFKMPENFFFKDDNWVISNINLL